MGAIVSCCQDSQVKAEEFVNEAKEKGLVEATKDTAASAGEAIKEKAEQLATDAQSGKLVEDIKEAVTTAAETVQETVTGVVEDAKSGKLQEDLQTAATDAGAALSGVTAAAAEAMGPSVTLVFEQAGKTTEVKFTKRTLGFEYGAQKAGGCCAAAPTGKFVVTKVTNPELKDVKVGMLIKKINEEEVPATMELGEFKEKLTVAVKTLPEA
eukprot:CAMPEP_0197648404 /NCGR_PEP_ID=MMETSP1338-20131121/27733_1 /TAXON_ID=43686 ORGANISM="Pelagodinium beii, Strain RCC1491" /NCGR_SAMPLE_ID=MMETSP1338 /ASSEMBLY_ACC=CAM_ASM_000754 /LENGTH=210 /DNA_ID=CAMNT_0043222393 /DNA_START=66 /DNA_END=698 /DNA_ORIENTATION=+